MNFKKELNSFRVAIDGLVDLYKNHGHFRFHVWATVAVVAAGFYFQISKTEWFAVLLAIALVNCLEAMNTALEYLTDLVSPGHHPLAGKAKDAAAAAVLVASIFAVAIGLMVFLPKIFTLNF